jgi:peptidoglycan/xylan/chitin deacetylase (PgdA/CDA1 family)
MANLWSENAPAKFWLCEPELEAADWQTAIGNSISTLGLAGAPTDQNELLALILGEAQFGPEHWKLSRAKKLYYILKPILPRLLTEGLRRGYSRSLNKRPTIDWPVDSRYPMFQYEIVRQLLLLTGRESISHTSFWPNGNAFAFVLTHDIETARGQEFVREIANLEESLGFKSSFNFVLERYPINASLIHELQERGFEIGCHGLKHDGKLFNSPELFARRAARINTHLKEYGMVGFRSPLTLRNPEWMQALNIEYDSSFFDTDPFEPIPGGVMSIWPYFCGRFVELPYTLAQDHTLTAVLGETTPRLWLEKVGFIKEYRGMALLNSHPDYLRNRRALGLYADFLDAMKNIAGYWHALPRNAAQWWRTRANSAQGGSSPASDLSRIALVHEKIQIV